MTSTSLRLLAAATLACVAAPASADDDSDLFDDNEHLRIGDADEHITFAPFLQLDAGYSNSNSGGGDVDANVRLARLYVFAKTGDFNGTFAYDFQNDNLRHAFGAYQFTDKFNLSACERRVVRLNSDAMMRG